ncbi:hypothetical protein [Streptomyces hygroscopicus]|uniref:hypothetical protein n=1 Tax=Streptomyces hygroscopicus TaxID=1912 RepID=UPI003F1CAC1D
MHTMGSALVLFLIGCVLHSYTLLRHAVINLRVRRLGFMYTTNVSIGDDEYEHAVKVMHGMGRELCGVFRLDGRVSHKADDELFQKEWEAFAETRPQAVIIMGAPNSTTEPFVQQMMKDPRTNSAYLMAPSMLEKIGSSFLGMQPKQRAHLLSPDK